MDVAKDQFASSRLLARALEAKDYTTFFDFNSRTIEFTSPKGALWKTSAAHISYPFNSSEVRRFSINKNLGYELAQEAGFSIPNTRYLADGALSDDEALQLLQNYKTLIVKPNDLSLSKGLTVNIKTTAQLKQAITYARTYSPSVLIQEQVVGEEIRFAVLNGKVRAALLRQTAQVVGDGHSTIAELIKQENKAREKLVFEYISYPQLTAAIIDESLMTDQRIPTQNEVVKLARSTMIRGGCSVYNILDQVDKSYVDKVEALVARLGAGFVVVDVFCTDFAQPAAPSNHWLIEFNSAPVLKLFYGCRDGNHFDIVPLLAEMIDNHLDESSIDVSR